MSSEPCAGRGANSCCSLLSNALSRVWLSVCAGEKEVGLPGFIGFFGCWISSGFAERKDPGIAHITPFPGPFSTVARSNLQIFWGGWVFPGRSSGCSPGGAGYPRAVTNCSIPPVLKQPRKSRLLRCIQAIRGQKATVRFGQRCAFVRIFAERPS